MFTSILFLIVRGLVQYMKHIYHVLSSIIVLFRGVGTGKIIGRVHIAQLKLGETYFAMSITILESSDVEFLFGLDMLRRHRCAIDLAKNALRIEGHSGCEEIPFI